MTKAQFTQQADAICAEADKAQLSGLGDAEKKAKADGSPPVERKERLLAAAMQPLQKEAEEIAELTAPAGDEKQVASIIDGIETAVKESEADVQNLNTAFNDVNQLATQ